MGDRICIMLDQDIGSGRTEESPVMYSHWGGLYFLQAVNETVLKCEGISRDETGIALVRILYGLRDRASAGKEDFRDDLILMNADDGAKGCARYDNYLWTLRLADRETVWTTTWPKYGSRHWTPSELASDLSDGRIDYGE